MAAAGLADLLSAQVPALAAATTAVVVLSCAAVLRRALLHGPERGLWARLAAAWAIGCSAVGGEAALALAGAPDALRGAVVVAAWMGAFLLGYGGLIRWNRYPTALADPHDLLNGVSSVLAALALLDVVLRLSWTPVSVVPWWRFVGVGTPLAVVVVLLGTAAALPRLAGLAGEPRLWLVVSSLAGAVSTAALHLVGRLAPNEAAAVLVAPGAAVSAALLAAAALLPAAPRRRLPTDPTASTTGAFGVLLVALLVLVALWWGRGSAFAVVCAAAAAVGTGLRMRNNTIDLALLAPTRRLALTDEMTGLANRRALVAELEDRCASGAPVVLALLDLDRFKEVNDGLGHAAGDELIVQVARRLQGAVAPAHLLARIGGDEFALVADVAPGADAAVVADELGPQLVSALSEPFPLAAMTVHSSLSAGLALSEQGGAESAAELLRRADAAMYEAKRDGRGAAVYDAEVHARTAGQLALAEELRAALVTGELLLHHQVQVTSATGAVSGVEALVRWAHPQRGLLAPGEFLPTAEAHGLVGRVSEEVLGLAVAQLAAWRAVDVHVRMSVNLSATDLLDATLPQRVAVLLHAHGVPAHRLVLEITETVLISDTGRSLAVLDGLAALGVGLSIDDYGSGYSSLAYLQQLPVHELKLDRSFTRDLLSSTRARAVVSSTVELAHALDLRVVAEGVEDEHTLRVLVELGCDETQGFFHAPPLLASEVVAHLRRPAAATAHLLPGPS